MILLREHPEKFGELIKRKSPDFNTNELIELDKKVRDLKVSVESLRQKKNDLANQAKSGVTAELREASIVIGKELKAQEKVLEDALVAFDSKALTCPNIPFEDVPLGNKEENVVVREYDKKPVFAFPIKNHLELAEQNQWFSLEAGTKMAASNFVFYRGDAVKVMYALTRLMLKNNTQKGYEPVLPPYVANEETLTVSGNFPKFKDEVFKAPEDNLYLIPTSEVCLANLYRNEIIPTSELPKKMTSWTSCFRREAGNYGKTERGLIRIHQFEKVELFALTQPEKSENQLNEMIQCAEDILQKLGLHYRVSLLAAQDCSFQSAKTFDIEVWLPGQERYYEVSSASNCTDFQSRRGKIRYRDGQDDKPQLVHTLNASSLAIPRLMVALMETYQQEDGTIKLPEVLVNEMF